MDFLTLFTALKLAGQPSKADVADAVEDWLDNHPEATTTVQDGSITESKLSATVKSKINNASSLTPDIKQALLACFEHVAWTDAHGQDYVDALEAALYPPAELASISAVYTQSGTVYTTDTLDSLKTNLVVTAHYTDSTTETVTTYTLSGTLTEGTSVITVSYGGKTTTFNVTVTAPATLSSITAVYTQSGTVYDTDTLDSLKTDLVVTAVYSDSTTQTVASTDYTLSGTLTEGTSTITVSYGGKTDTFDVTVTHVVSEEILSTFADSAKVNATTFENESDTNNWVLAPGTLKASQVNLSWDTEECNLFQIIIYQYDSSGTPYKMSNKNVYASNPLTDGAQFDSWTNPGGASYYTAISGGNFTISLPTSGVFKMAIRRASGSGTAVDGNQAFGTWLHNGGVTITAHI